MLYLYYTENNPGLYDFRYFRNRILFAFSYPAVKFTAVLIYVKLGRNVGSIAAARKGN